MNAHQRRKARRKDREPWSVIVFDDESAAMAHALKFGAAFYRVQPNTDVRPLLTGEIGRAEGMAKRPYVVSIPSNYSETWMKALKGDGTGVLPEGIPLIRGEIGTIGR